MKTAEIEQVEGVNELAVADQMPPYPGDVELFKRRMLEWDNPVEYVNNMYGCHPDDDDNEYFEVVFARE